LFQTFYSIISRNRDVQLTADTWVGHMHCCVCATPRWELIIYMDNTELIKTAKSLGKVYIAAKLYEWLLSQGGQVNRNDLENKLSELIDDE